MVDEQSATAILDATATARRIEKFSPTFRGSIEWPMSYEEEPSNDSDGAANVELSWVRFGCCFRGAGRRFGCCFRGAGWVPSGG